MVRSGTQGERGRFTAASRWRRNLGAGALALLALCGAAEQRAEAFCGFYVAGADAKLFNNATMVVMMREGTRTVLSMQNNYQGPPENFAMVVPVPVVLQKENVKTLSNDVFDHVDKLASPRLVEYWEQDPCPPDPPSYAYEDNIPAAPMAEMAAPAPAPKNYGVKIEAKFAVGEYEIVILSANDSGGLDRWLRDSGYKIPAGAEPLLRPYVQSGMKFFVAKVDVQKVRFENGMAMLSPLRFHYDTELFNLPIRLGLVNSGGTQDLIVHILARGVRYEVTNYKNVTIPTNIDIDEKARGQFAAFYAALFDRTVAQNPGAIVTEYAWGADSCDPCPSSPLDPNDFAILGGDVLPSVSEDQKWIPQNSFVLTRLHARYGKDALGEDLVFRVAPPIVGGREFMQSNGKLETGATQLPEGQISNFQGRYAIRHPWTGPIKCSNPRRGVWGGPPSGVSDNGGPQVAQNLAFAPRGTLQLASYVQHDVPEIGLQAAVDEPRPGPGSLPPSALTRSGGCASCGVGAEGSAGRYAWLSALVGVAGLGMLLSRRRRG
jgi:MYXO-CTERM domain-containing protein